MEVWVAIAGLFAIVFAPVVRLAYEHDRKWPMFRSRVYWTCLPVVGAIAVLGTAVGVAFLFGGQAEKGVEILSAAYAICVIVAGLALLTWVADWLRRP